MLDSGYVALKGKGHDFLLNLIRFFSKSWFS